MLGNGFGSPTSRLGRATSGRSRLRPGRLPVVVGAVAVAVAMAVTGAASAAGRPTGTGATTTLRAAPAAAAATGNTLVIGTDLPLQGASKAASDETNQAIELYLSQIGHQAGPYTIQLRAYDDSTAASARWDAAQCQANASAHIANTDEVAVVGPYNSGCAKIMVPILDQDPAGPMLMVSHANSNPGLTKKWDTGEPGKYYPRGIRNYARVTTTDEVQGVAAATLAAKRLHVKRVFVLDDNEVYGHGVAAAFAQAAKKAGVKVVGRGSWSPTAADYRALFRRIKAARADAVYLGGIFDNNGGQLIKDKVAVLGSNSTVKLIGSDGFTAYPELDAMRPAQGAYLTFPGLTTDSLLARGGAAAAFLRAYKAKYGAYPRSSYALYGVAAVQLVLEAVKHSGGTRAGVRNAVFSGRGLTVGASTSVLGRAFSIDPRTGDVTLKDITVEVVRNSKEQVFTIVSVR